MKAVHTSTQHATRGMERTETILCPSSCSGCLRCVQRRLPAPHRRLLLPCQLPSSPLHRTVCRTPPSSRAWQPPCWLRRAPAVSRPVSPSWQLAWLDHCYLHGTCTLPQPAPQPHTRHANAHICDAASVSPKTHTHPNRLIPLLWCMIPYGAMCQHTCTSLCEAESMPRGLWRV